MIKHPLGAPSMLGDGPSTLACRKQYDGRGGLVRSVGYFFYRRSRCTEWLAAAYQDLVARAVFDLRCDLALNRSRAA